MDKEKELKFTDIEKEMQDGLEILIADYINVNIPDQTDEIKKVAGNIFRDNFSHLLISAHNCGYVAGKKYGSGNNLPQVSTDL